MIHVYIEFQLLSIKKYQYHKSKPTTTWPTSFTFILPNEFLTSLPTRFIHSLSSSVIETSSGGMIGLGALIVWTSRWYFNDRSPKSNFVIELAVEFNSFILIVFLILALAYEGFYARVRSTICLRDSSSWMESCKFRCGPGWWETLTINSTQENGLYMGCSLFNSGCRSPSYKISIYMCLRSRVYVCIIIVPAETSTAECSHPGQTRAIFNFKNLFQIVWQEHEISSPTFRKQTWYNKSSVKRFNSVERTDYVRGKYSRRIIQRKPA